VSKVNRARKARKVKVKAKRLPRFLSTLREEHRYFESLIEIAREQQELLASGGEADFKILEELLQYLTEYPEDYHHPREDILFARLREIDPESGVMLDSLLSGHEEIHNASSHLYYTVMRANSGENIRRKRLADSLDRFVQGYEKHIHDEDEIIFARALEVMTDQDWADVEGGMEHIEDPLFGKRVRRRYRHLANVLEARIGVAERDLVVAEYLTLGALIDSLMTISDATVNVGAIVRQKVNQTLQENLSATRDGFGSGEITEVLKLPSRYGDNSLRNLRNGFSESRDLLCRAVEDIRTPYNMRVDTLKDILREDWSRG
jgi:hemerythrin-like domain-containing protein